MICVEHEFRFDTLSDLQAFINLLSSIRCFYPTLPCSMCSSVKLCKEHRDLIVALGREKNKLLSDLSVAEQRYCQNDVEAVHALGG